MLHNIAQVSVSVRRLPRHVHMRIWARCPLEATAVRPIPESMTRTTRRTTRNSAPRLLGSDATGSGSPAVETDLACSLEDLCPSCSVSLTRDQVKDEDSESWVRCDFCKTWYHWRCVGENGQLEAIDKWFVLPLPSVILLILSTSTSQVLRSL